MYIDAVKDIHDPVVTSLKNIVEETNTFLITISIHHGSAWSPYSFPLVINDLNRYIQDEIPWYMLFIDDIEFK